MATRPTKKQYELLAYLREFIKEHGYSPSYREIMQGCSYTSVATVSLHINNLIKRGHVIKRGKSARSLEVVAETASEVVQELKEHTHELVVEVEKRLSLLKNELSQDMLDEVYVLVGALKVLGHHEKAREYAVQLHRFSQ